MKVFCIFVFLLSGCDQPKISNSMSDINQITCEEVVKCFSLDAKIESFNVVNKDLRSCLKVLIESSDPVYELRERIVLIDDVDLFDGSNDVIFSSYSEGLTMNVENIPVGVLLRELCRFGMMSLSYRVLNNGEISAIIISPLVDSGNGYRVGP